MTTREKFKRRVIELIHGLSYEDAIKKEQNTEGSIISVSLCQKGEPIAGYPIEKTMLVETDNRKKENNGLYYIYRGIIEYEEYYNYGLPITIGRVIQAIRNLRINYGKSVNEEYKKKIERLMDIREYPEFKKFKNGQECTDDDQKDETIEKLYELIK